MQRSVWGWGFANQQPPQLKQTREMLDAMLPKPTFRLAEPDVDAWATKLRQPRFPKPTLTAHVSDDAKVRMSHSLGKSFRDVARGVMGMYENVVDYVVFPQSQAQVQEVLAWATRVSEEGNAVDLIPYGGGSSVVGGIEPRKSAQRVVSVNLTKLDKVVSVNTTDMTAAVQAGVLGPDLIRRLKQFDKTLTLRHFPQSFSFSTVGGWLATRSGGHYASNKTYIDDFVVSMTVVTAKGVMKTTSLPASGAGPVADKLFLGSEGAFGIITECTLRIQREPQFKCSTTVVFDCWRDGLNATRQIAQSALYPTQCRLMQGLEAVGYGLIEELAEACLVLGFESSSIDRLEDRFMQPCLDICLQNHGRVLPAAPASRHTAGDTFRNSFVTAPYLRDHLILDGYIMETFETACSWSNFDKLDRAVRSAVESVGKPVILLVRFTHVYPDGPAPYYTLTTQATSSSTLVSEWDTLKRLVSNALVANGGTITHHHAVGKDHLPWLAKEKDPLWIELLQQVKAWLDPAGCLNPGTLVPHSAPASTATKTSKM